MVYSEELLHEIRKILKNMEGIHEKNMFGGVAFMLNGNMACGIVKDDLMVRIGKENYEKAMKKPFVKEMDFTGKPMKSMIYVDAGGLEDLENLRYWIFEGINYAASLPKK